MFVMRSYCSSKALRTAIASWSAHEVLLKPHVFPLSFASICSTVIPSVSFDIALRFPLHPPVKAILLITFPFMSNEMAVEHVPVVLFVYLINALYHVFAAIVTRQASYAHWSAAATNRFFAPAPRFFFCDTLNS